MTWGLARQLLSFTLIFSILVPYRHVSAAEGEASNPSPDSVPVGTSFGVAGDNKIEVTTYSGELLSPSQIASQLSRSSDSGITDVHVLSLEAPDDRDRATRDIEGFKASFAGDSEFSLSVARQTVDLNVDSPSATEEESQVSKKLLRYQYSAASPTWTAIKVIFYTGSGYYLLFRSSGSFDWLMPAMTVFIAGICAWRIEKVNEIIENARLIYPLVNRIQSTGENSAAKKVALAMSRLVDPFVGAVLFESFMYYFILQYQDYRQTLNFPFEHEGQSIWELGKKAFKYGTISFFGDYAMALAFQKATAQSSKMSVLAKHVANYHFAMIISLIVFAGNMASDIGVGSWIKPAMLTMAWTGSLGYVYVKLPVVKALLAGLLRAFPYFRESPVLRSWFMDVDFEKDFISYPELKDAYPKQVKALRKAKPCGAALRE